MSKFVYEKGDIVVGNSICELCVHYNNGKHSDKCPADLIEAIKRNEAPCPNYTSASKARLDVFRKKKS